MDDGGGGFADIVCAICTERITATYTFYLKCGHVFHKPCAGVMEECPTCTREPDTRPHPSVPVSAPRPTIEGVIAYLKLRREPLTAEQLDRIVKIVEQHPHLPDEPATQVSQDQPAETKQPPSHVYAPRPGHPQITPVLQNESTVGSDVSALLAAHTANPTGADLVFLLPPLESVGHDISVRMRAPTPTPAGVSDPAVPPPDTTA